MTDETPGAEELARETFQLRISNEQLYYDVLARISRDYRSAESLLKRGDCGLDGVEALEMAYDNIQASARAAIKGKRRPK